MKRRAFVAGLAGAAALRVASANAQPSRLYRIGVLTGLPPATPNYLVLWNGLARLGFVEGQNLEVDHRGYSLQPGDLAAARGFLGHGALAFRAAQRATATIPIMGE